MRSPLKLLVVGGYGTFGGRLVELLKDEPRLEIVVAGRSASQGAAFCSACQDAVARLVPATFDRNGDAPEQLRTLAPDILVDASGPFQAYGEGRYRLIEACIAQGIHYLDLADGSEFVAGVRAFDAAARAAGVYVLSGVSSFPVLTAAVVRHLSSDMTRVASIRGGIAPSPYAGVGENVIRAIAGYAGQPVALRRSGKFSTGYPLTENLRFTIAPPGRIPLKSTLFSLVDVPDLRALDELWPGTDEIWMGAGPVPEVLHRALVCLAWLVRWRLLPSLSSLARLMFFATNQLRWGEHRGGMFVVVEGTHTNGRTVRRSWHLLADGDDGPFIPSMAIEAIVRKALDGQQPALGARAAVNDLELANYETLFANRTIHIGTRDETADNCAPLFARLLGDAWRKLPTAVRQMHALSSERLTEGRCTVERGSGIPSNWVASLFGFPKAADDLPVSVRFNCENGREHWTRKFGEEVFSSTLRAGRGTSERLLCERVGLFDFAQALVVEGDRLRLVLRQWSIFGIPLPSWLAPRSNSYETEQDGRFRFHVEISHPWTGLIVGYRGWLVVAAREGSGSVL
jgi:Domain of unknown function (DUF4166)/Saccharopine dehydrogenase NADP binding domain